MGYSNLRRLGIAIASFLLVNAARFDGAIVPTLELNIPSVQARSSGGRSGGGSFRSTPSRSSGSSTNSRPSNSSGNSNTSPSYSNPSYSNPSYNNPPRDPYYDNRGGTVVVPVPAAPGYSAPSTYNNGGVGIGTMTLIGLLLIGGTGTALLLLYLWNRVSKHHAKGLSGELDNSIVSVNKVQVALLAEARELQAELTKMSLDIDTDTPEGLHQLLQESVLALLRNPETWSHVQASSQTVKTVEEAETLFNQLSITERSKFSVETLTNVDGRRKQQNFTPDPDQDPASYIVVTLLVGTAHDRPLFADVRTTETLKDALQNLAAIPPDYLLVFELLWSPQDTSDSLTYDELLTEYTDMVQI